MSPNHDDHDHPMGDDVHDLHDEEEQDPEGEDYINPDDIEIIDADDYDGDLPMDEDDDGFDEGEGEEEQPSAPVEDNSLAQNVIHESSVFTVHLHPSFPNPPLAVSGGEDDLAYIFCPISPPKSASEAEGSDAPSTSAAGQLSGFHNENFPPIKLTGHTDSVASAAFSSDGELIATGGMDGKVRIWKRVQKGGQAGRTDAPAVDDWKSWEFLTSLETGDEITWLAWHPRGPVLAAGCNDSTVWMWQLPSGNTMQVFSSHTDSSSAGRFTPNGKLLITTSADSTLCVYDPRENAPVLKLGPSQASNYGQFDGGITALAVSPASNLLAIGGADGTLRIINLPNGHVVAALAGHAEGESVEGLAFMDILGLAGPSGDGSTTKGLLLVSCGTDGKAIVWDVTTGKARAEVQHEDVVTAVYGHPSPHHYLFTTASADRKLKTWDARQGALIATHEGHHGTVNDVKVGAAPSGWGLEAEGVASQQPGEVIVSAGDDGAVLAWRV